VYGCVFEADVDEGSSGEVGGLGIEGNGHIMVLERNSKVVLGVVEKWIEVIEGNC
jgi:hypothetical protein